MAFSSVGKTKVAGHIAFLLFDIVVLAFSTRVNQFQDFFYVADLFPLALSIVSLVVVTALLAIDVAIEDSYTGRAQVDIAVFGVLSIFWLAFNSFSTSRWRLIPFKCDEIPFSLVDERVWCKDLQILKAFVWIAFVASFLITVFTIRYAITQYTMGNKHIFSMSLSKYRPEWRSSEKGIRSSEFMQFEEKPVYY